MIKRILSLAIILATVLVVFAGCSGSNPVPSGLKENPASDFEYGDVASTNGVEIKKYTGTSMSVRIPEKTEGEPVTDIGAEAFKDSGIMEIYIPNSVTYIGDKAFHDCTGLTNITIPDSVTVIGKDALVDCKGYATYRGNAYDLCNSDDLNALYYAIITGEW